MSDMTARLHLPTIRPGQAQKELFHNEALAVIDLLTQASVIDFAVDVPPSTPLPGEAWVIGTAPTGEWSGKAHQLAGWTEGGWRFVAPSDGLSVWVSQAAVIARFSGGTWTLGSVPAKRVEINGDVVLRARQPAIGNAAGGSVIDVEARAAIAALLATLRTHGLIQS